MKNKRITLITISIISIIVSVLILGGTLLIETISRMNTGYMISRFGPDHRDPDNTYSDLYQMTLSTARYASKYALLFHMTLAIGLLVIGIICACWSRDLKQIKN